MVGPERSVLGDDWEEGIGPEKLQILQEVEHLQAEWQRASPKPHASRAKAGHRAANEWVWSGSDGAEFWLQAEPQSLGSEC